MLSEAKAQSKGYNFFVEILIFIAVFIVTSLISSLVPLAYDMVKMFESPDAINAVMEYNAGNISFEEYQASIASVTSETTVMIISLFCTGLSTIATILFCKLIEKRGVSTMGFRKTNLLPEYLVGMVIGTAMFSAAVLICVLTGALRFEGTPEKIKWGVIALFFVGFLVQGMSEEVTFRGYFMVSLSRRNHIAVAVALSSIAFGCAHLGNSNVSLLPVFNIVLFGAFAGIYILKRGSIWGACAIHSLWNFVQGNVYGISVSGIITADSVFKMTSVESKTLINGGDFGLEGGLAVTVVLCVCIVALLLTKTKKSEIAGEAELAAEAAEAEAEAAARETNNV